MDETGSTMTGLEQALRELGGRIAYPPTPSLSLAVRTRLASDRAQLARPPFPGRALWSRRRVLVFAVLGLLLLATAAVAARLGIGAIEIRIVPTLAPGSPTFETRPSLGEPVTLEEAQAQALFPVGLPAALPAPDRISLAESYTGDRVVLAWRATQDLPRIRPLPWGAVLMEFTGFAGSKDVAAKEVPGGILSFVDFQGSQAIWIRGPHDLVLRTASGEQRFRVTGNVLLWERRGVTYRLETSLDQASALRLAASVETR